PRICDERLESLVLFRRAQLHLPAVIIADLRWLDNKKNAARRRRVGGQHAGGGGRCRLSRGCGRRAEREWIAFAGRQGKQGDNQGKKRLQPVYHDFSLIGFRGKDCILELYGEKIKD